jgi:hypothetical protein
LLSSNRWDYVTIQQYSLQSHDPATYRPFASNLWAYIRQHAPQAEVLLHETWAYRCDDARFTGKPSATNGPGTQAAMYTALRGAYDGVAAELGLRVIPVGDAFHAADTDPHWGYVPDRSFDVAHAVRPALPDQTHSLHAGWRWDTNKADRATLKMDGHHGGPAGQYLAGCVWFEVLFNQSVVGNAFVPQGVDGDYARFLQQTAHEAVEKRRRGQPGAPPGAAPAAPRETAPARQTSDADARP